MPSLALVRTAAHATVLILLTTPLATAAELPESDWYRSAPQAWALARSADRPLLLYFTTSGCVYCRKMQAETLQDAAVARELREHFVAAALTAEENRRLVRSLRIRVYPTTVILDPDAGVIDSIAGYLAAEPLLARLRAAAPRNVAAGDRSTHTR